MHFMAYSYKGEGWGCHKLSGLRAGPDTKRVDRHAES